MKNVELNSESFKSLNEIFREFNKFELKGKIETLRNIAKNITYNEDQQNFCFKNNFVGMILDDIFDLPKNSEDTLKDNEIYVKLFFLFFHNSIIGNVDSQCKVFEDIFLNPDAFRKLNTITQLYIYDNKIKKFLLSIFFNLYFSNSKNFTRISKDHFDYFLMVLKNLNYNVSPIELQNDKDLSEINDWVHILLKNILKSEVNLNLNGSHPVITDNSSKSESHTQTFLFHLLNLKNKQESILILELFRDYVDYAKDSNNLYIYEENLKLFIELFYKNILTINSHIVNFNHASFDEYEKLIFDDFSEISYIFREFLCLVDILSVFLISEDNFYNYRRSIQVHLDAIYKLNNYSMLIEIFHNLLKLTDNFYDTTFKRNRSLNPEEAKGVPILNEKNILFGFQTNVMKILSNFSLKNEELKSYLVDNPNVFYYFMNHMKLDKCNPFKKEWAVLFVKSAAESNLKIQNFIQELQPHSIDPLLKDYIINKGTDVKMNGPDAINQIKKCQNENEENDQ